MRLAAVLRSASRSIAGRMTIWFTATSLVLLLSKSLFSYWTVAPWLTSLEADYVAARARLIAVQLAYSARGSQPQALLPNSAELIRIRLPDGRVLAETPAMREEIPEGDGLAPPKPVLVRGHSGRQYWVATNVVGHGGPTLVVQVASRANEFRLLAPWGGRLWLALAAALVLSGLAGYRIARKGIRPLQDFADNLHAIGTTTLERRVDPSRLPTELLPLCGTFNTMLDRLQEAFGRVSQFSDNIAHELRTPLGVMANQIDVTLEAERSPQEYREVLESAREELTLLSDLVDRLLFLSRVENHTVALNPESLDVVRDLQALQDFYEPLAAEAGVELSVAVGGPTIPVLADRVLLRRAIGNLVVNAIRHTPAGGCVVMAAEPAGDHVRVTVTDTGCGIEAEHLPRLFDRFFRMDRARHGSDGHVGLGLAIAKAIVTLHHGTIALASEPGKGTAVTLSLPRP